MAANVKLLGITAILLFAYIIVHVAHSNEGATALLEVDGIPLDSNAAAVLRGRHSRGFSAPDPSDKLLHKQEAGELDGIALDKNAASLLAVHPTLHLKTFSALPTPKHLVRKRAGLNLPAQKYLERGEADLSAGRYGSAVRLLKKARRLWKGQNSGNSHFARTLIHDIEKAHPAAKNGGYIGPSLENKLKSFSNRGRITEGMRAAAKNLSNGKEFRSLYGLMRDQHHENSRSSETSLRSSQLRFRANAHSARTTLLSENRFGSHPDKLEKLIHNELSLAEKQLEQHNKMILQDERKQILKDLAARKHPAGALATAPILSWPSNQIPSSLELAWNPTTKSSRVSLQAASQQTQDIAPQAIPMRYSQPSQQNQAQYLIQSPLPQQQEEISNQKSTQQLAEKPEYNQELSAKADGNPPVPVINLNLPAGEKLPPGRYALDGSVVPDAAGQLDFVGNLVRVSPPGVL